ncbi:MAG: hypothetical protein AB1728_01090 [Bacteroidota bacterium]
MIVILSKRVLFASASKDEPKLEAALAQGDYYGDILLSMTLLLYFDYHDNVTR